MFGRFIGAYSMYDEERFGRAVERAQEQRMLFELEREQRRRCCLPTDYGFEMEETWL